MQEQKDLHRQIRKQSLGYILAAFGFVAGLAWNEAIKGLIDFIFPIGGNGIAAKFAYAIIVTALVVVATIIGTRLSKDKSST